MSSNVILDEMRAGKSRAEPDPETEADAPEAAPAEVVTIAPIAPRAAMRGRHWGLLLAFLALFVAPLVAVGLYLSDRAVDQFSSDAGFTVQQEGGEALTGIVAQVAGGTTQSETDVLHKFIQSPAIVARIDARLDLVAHYSAPHARDPVFALAPDASSEELVAYWARVVRVAYDQSSRLIEIEVRAFDPDFAQRVAQEIVAESQSLINELNATARSDAIRFAESDLREAAQRMRESREALIQFRTRTQIVDPVTDLAGRLGVVNTLQQQLAEALVEYDLLLESTRANDPRVAQAERQIRVIRNRIAQERINVSQGDGPQDGTDYPTLLAEYEGLLAERDFAEQSYLAALTALDTARANAARQSRYVATFIAPTLADTPEYPRRVETFLLTGFFLFLSWAILALIFYALRDNQ
jgi:capsular polysaccharide transport system permease protein